MYNVIKNIILSLFLLISVCAIDSRSEDRLLFMMLDVAVVDHLIDYEFNYVHYIDARKLPRPRKFNIERCKNKDICYRVNYKRCVVYDKNNDGLTFKYYRGVYYSIHNGLAYAHVDLRAMRGGDFIASVVKYLPARCHILDPAHRVTRARWEREKRRINELKEVIEELRIVWIPSKAYKLRELVIKHIDRKDFKWAIVQEIDRKMRGR